MLRNHIAVIINTCVFFFSCGGEAPVIEINGGSWPEGTVVSAVRENGGAAAVSELFGDRVRLSLPKSGVYSVRASHPEYLTATTPKALEKSGVSAVSLPAPVGRRRVGSSIIDLAFTVSGVDGLYAALLDSASGAFSSISFDPDEATDVGELVRLAHARVVEVIMRESGDGERTGTGMLKAGMRLVETAERHGADGIEVVFVRQPENHERLLAAVREVAEAAHRKGMTVTVRLFPESLGYLDPVSLFAFSPSSGCPDAIVLQSGGSGISGKMGSPVSVAQTEDALRQMREAKIPLSRVMVEMRLGAMAWEETDGGMPGPVSLRAGDLERMLQEAGESGVIRLGDGSLRLVYRGIQYAYEDMRGLARKAEFLRTGDMARVRGVRIVCDGTGMQPDPEGLRTLAAVFAQ